MSFSVDDLVNSLSSSHIGQEATDLATLQAQLSQTLFGGPSVPSSSSSARQVPSRGRQHTQPCNTPLARTPSSSFSGWNLDTRRAPSSNRRADSYLDDMEEDERMVEELLIPSSPLSTPSTTSFTSNAAHYSNAFSQQMPSSPVSPSYQGGFAFSSNPSSASTPSYQTSPPSSYVDPSPSLFTSTDPFYLAQLQASQTFNNSSPQSVFTQNGRISQTSPFVQTQYQTQYHHHTSQYHPQTWDNQPLAMAF
ncbi:hypothetical protein B0H34DRAFT_214198 [Crassisporium funariophilum]|nr:hypothetical protein B0H34DRAFT_214198 [Crassisporium funariophilum]